MNNDDGDDREPDPAGNPGAAFDAVEAVVRDGYLDGMYRRLQGKFPDLPAQSIEDALHHATEKCTAQTKVPDNVRAWLFAVAQRKLIDITRQKPSEPFDPEDPGNLLGIAPSAEDEVVAAEDAARAEAAFRRTTARVKSWSSAKTQTVILLVLTAAHEGVPLSNSDLAESAGALLNEEMTASTAAVLKSRGLTRLRAEYPDIQADDALGDHE